MAIPCLLFFTFAFVPIAIVVLPTADAFKPTATLAVLNAAPLLVEYAPLPIAILSLLSAFASVPITTTLNLLDVAPVPIPTAFKPVTLAPLPIPTAFAPVTLALLPIPTASAPVTLALLPKPTAFVPVTVAPLPKATDAPPVVGGTSFTANATLPLVIANAAKIPATTIFFLPLLFLANSDTTT